MLRNTNDLNNFVLQATDGEIGHIKDMYFDDDAWVLRYFVVETGTWLSSRKVLVSPMAVQEPDWLGRSVAVSLTKAQIGDSPPIDTDKPVSRQNEEQYLGYFGYPLYWGGEGLWGEGMYPYSVVPGYVSGRADWAERQREDEAALKAERERHRNDDPHLRSCESVIGYHLEALDGEIGHVTAFLVDEVTWAIRYLVVETSNWWMGNKVLIAPASISGVHWSSETASVNLSREAVQASPVYDPDTVHDRAWQMRLREQLGSDKDTSASASTSTSTSTSSGSGSGSSSDRARYPAPGALL